MPRRIYENKMKDNNPDLEKKIEENSGLQKLVIDYIGTHLNAPEEITVDMAVEVFAAEFPEFLMAVAEENFLRGYRQALDDVEAFETTKTNKQQAVKA